MPITNTHPLFFFFFSLSGNIWREDRSLTWAHYLPAGPTQHNLSDIKSFYTHTHTLRRKRVYKCPPVEKRKVVSVSTGMRPGTDLCQKSLIQRNVDKEEVFFAPSEKRKHRLIKGVWMWIQNLGRRRETHTHFPGSCRFISLGHRSMKWAFNKYVIAQSFCHSVDPTLHSRHYCTFSPTPFDISLAFRAASFIKSRLGVKCGLQAYWAQFFMSPKLSALGAALYH